MRPRPHIPIVVRCRVALRQLGELWPDDVIRANRFVPRVVPSRSLDKLLGKLLERLADLHACEVKDLRLDHEPQLALRPYNGEVRDVAARYTPNANDPACLTYRPQGRQFANSHDVKSNVRGDHGQLSDTALRKKARRINRRKMLEAAAGKPVALLKVIAKKPRRFKAPARKIAARKSPWPKGRKIPTRRKDR